MKQEMLGWQWHQLDHMQITFTSLYTDNHVSISSLIFFTGRMLFRMTNQQSQGTKGYSTNLRKTRPLLYELPCSKTERQRDSENGG